MLFLVLLEREENQQRREQSGQRDGVTKDVQRVYEFSKLKKNNEKTSIPAITRAIQMTKLNSLKTVLQVPALHVCIFTYLYNTAFAVIEILLLIL